MSNKLPNPQNNRLISRKRIDASYSKFY